MDATARIQESIRTNNMKKSLVFTLAGLAVVIIAGFCISCNTGYIILMVMGSIVAIFSFLMYAMDDGNEYNKQ